MLSFEESIAQPLLLLLHDLTAWDRCLACTHALLATTHQLFELAVAGDLVSTFE